MREIDQSKYAIEQIFKRQKPNCNVKKLLSTFHAILLLRLEQNQRFFMVRAHVIGFSYFCNIRKAFMFLNVRKSFL